MSSGALPGSVPEIGYAELCATSNFTFLTGASHPEELVTRAAELGLEAIAITDRNSLAGTVRAWRALKLLRKEQGETVPIRSQQRIDSSSRQQIGNPAGIARPKLGRLPRLIVGCRLVLRDSAVEWVALPTDLAAYQRLARLLTLGKRRAEKGACHLDLADVLEAGTGMIFIALPGADLVGAAADIQRVRQNFPGSTYLGAAPRYDGSDQAYFAQCAELAERCAAPMVVVGDVLMHHGARRQLADVLTCMRIGCTIDQIGTRALSNAERRLKAAPEMKRLARAHSAALRRSLEIAARCTFDLSELKYQYPDEVAETGETPMARLIRLTREGLTRRYPNGATPKARKLVAKELAIVEELDYAPYFLTVYDIVSFARSQGILCQGRGSAANSILCYLLGITDVPPELIGMVFERFISRHRGEPPDIDVDFEHERREEVIQWIYERYGRHRAGLCATVIHFRSRAAIREVGKVMGLSQDTIAGLSGQIWGHSDAGPDHRRLRELGLDPQDWRLAQALRLIAEIIGFPRHLSQHVGGFVITQGRLDEMVPIENAAMEGRTFIEWDKDDIEALEILKVDILALGMLTCIRKAFDLLKKHEGIALGLDTVPREDAATYRMLQRADAVGVFQVESRAQMNFLPRMKPKEFYDLVIEVAIVRPGPIQGGMVQPYIRRRQGLEKPDPFGPALEEVTRRTLGVPLFQEQALQVAVVGAGYTAEEADHLRRSLASFRRMGTIGEHRQKFIAGMLANGYDSDVAARCFAQIEGFADYGFPESHAASFALLVYVSAWLKCHHPAVFSCALLNAQPMGFYAPAQIVRDARDHQIEVRPICVNASAWDNLLEPHSQNALALRLGFRQIRGFCEQDADWIVAARGNGYRDPETVWLRAGVPPGALGLLAEADAFAGAGVKRRKAIWQVKAIKTPSQLPLFRDPIDGEGVFEPTVFLKPASRGEDVLADYTSTALTLRAHPMELLRLNMAPDVIQNCELIQTQHRFVSICGLVITRQRPGTASGVVFLTLEDETGVANVIVWRKVFDRYRRAVMNGRLLRVGGFVQKEGLVVNLIACLVVDMSSHMLSVLRGLGSSSGENVSIVRDTRHSVFLHPREQSKRLFPSRDFH